MNGRSFPPRRSLRALLLAGAVAQATPAAALERQEIETTLAAAMTQVVNQYVDPLDSGALTVRGLRALGALPEAAAPSRQAGIEQAILAARQAEGITPQTRILAGEILRFGDGAPREAALDAALRGMMTGLDPYSRVASRAELAPPPASVGLELSIRDGALTVVRPLPAGQGTLIVTAHRVHRANGARLDGTGVAPDMRLDEAKRRITVRDDIAADFNGALAQRVRDAVAGAPAGADVALLAARAALAHATAD
ncbi:hypothetical protein ACOTHJ_00290 [Achromobacter xylosoxidans]|uniref:hypothetical protein n=1 Tax=Alcaligenes xylosoxydans xylosoxydans TaxID=85698 RepID=UPI000AA46569|nr:hypothetical protein [Achromobacter xylosoxidans]PWV43461.1 hypothetical protein DDK21_01165 [Achromobacter xylosoxidans]